jgi:ABC-2 type transport system ATP-binding protein
LQVQVIDFERFSRLIPGLAREHGIRLLEVSPTDESLESVFSYLVGGR